MPTSFRQDREVGLWSLSQVGHQVLEELEGWLPPGLRDLMGSALEDHEEDAGILLLEASMLVTCEPWLAE